MEASPSGGEPLEWQFLQCFGERTPGEEIQEGAGLLHLPGGFAGAPATALPEAG